MFPAPCCGGGRMGMHRERQRGGRAIVCHRTQDRGGFGTRQSVSAELGGDRQREEFACTQQPEIDGGEVAGLVAAAPFLGELRTDFIESGAPVEDGGGGGSSEGQGSHGETPFFLLWCTL